MRAGVLLRLGSVLVACAVLAAVSAVEGTTPQALATSASVRAFQETPDATRQAIDSSTASVATHAVVASPSVGALPTTATTPSDLPVAALNAYERAKQVIDSVRPGCHLGWPVLAAIGQVESDHGRSAGGDLQIDGTSTKPVRGAVLDGSTSTARVADTDAGQLDGTSVWDRALGPMQFLPSTWINVRVDGDDDGIRSPDDIDDASLAAAVFLCAWGEDLATSTGAGAAVSHFNHTPGYVPTVLSLARAYGSDSYLANIWTGTFVQASANTPVPAPETETPTTSAAEHALHPVVDATKTNAAPSPTAAVKASPIPSATPTTTTTPAATPVATAPVVSTPTPTAPTLLTPTPIPTPTPPPTPMPTPTASPTATPTLAPTTLSGTSPRAVTVSSASTTMQSTSASSTRWPPETSTATEPSRPNWPSSPVSWT